MLRATSKDIHDIVDERCRVTFSGSGNVANAILLRPFVGFWIVDPHIVEPLMTVGAAKSEQC